MRALPAITSFASIVLATVPATAESGSFEVGARFGGGLTQLSQPTDPAGEPTVLFGTAFTGPSFMIGGFASRTLTTTGLGQIFANADLLLAHSRGTGWAESRTTAARREATIHDTSLRVPVLLGLSIPGDSASFSLAVGPELLLGIASGSSVKQEGLEGLPEPLPTKPATHLGIAADLGLTLKTAKFDLPVDARFTWDPMVKKSTRDRFDGYVSVQEPGKYTVAWSFQMLVLLGFSIDL